MDVRAKILLEKLLKAGDKFEAGSRMRSASLTSSVLSDYHNEKSLKNKETFEATMLAARAHGAVSITWDSQGEKNGFIARIDLRDSNLLANFLGETPLGERLSNATKQFEPLMKQFPVLSDLVQCWSRLRTVRKLGPDSIDKWTAAAKLIQHVNEYTLSEPLSVPIREMSARLFKDSKRIEKLTASLDILLVGSIDAESRQPEEVWQELGLFKEEQPVRLAGNVILERDRVTDYIDNPYIGLAANTVKRIVDVPQFVMTIENQTTFHSEARKHSCDPVLLIYTAGMPSPSWRSMYVRILRNIASSVPVYHWGDIDEGGFRIAAKLAKEASDAGHQIRPWMMHPDDIRQEYRKSATVHTLERIKHFATAAGWPELGDAIAQAGFTVEQESI